MQAFQYPGKGNFSSGLGVTLAAAVSRVSGTHLYLEAAGVALKMDISEIGVWHLTDRHGLARREPGPGSG